ncbi:MAG: hypothetical protein M1826_005775 [Phylliscum demangeonii]|nr:MAG: hypothetical protein M1826_005775 [Phylliscum demangeonii]
MGHTWDSYYYHHVKHHHVENNGPDDLSSTIRYQRDELSYFLLYLARFLLLTWIELPFYFFRKRKLALAFHAFLMEILSDLVIVLLLRYHIRPAVFVLLLPLLQMRIAMMVGNWGQHALVDEVEPDSDFRSSITLIDVAREHFLKSKHQYRTGRALVFRDIDSLMMTITLLRKDYARLASCLVPTGDQVGMSRQEIMSMLKSKTRRFSEEEIQRKFTKRRPSSHMTVKHV